MQTEVKVPAVGESISTGVLSSWHKKSGETVQAGEVLFSLDTDKISTEVNAPEAGVVTTLVNEGDEVQIGQIVATIETEVAAATAKPAAQPPAPEEATPQEQPQQPAKRAKKEPSEPPPYQPEPAQAKQAPQKTSPSTPEENQQKAPQEKSGRVTRKRLSPLRRKIAAQLVSAQQTAAILTTFNECDMSGVMRLRKELQEEFQKKHGVKLGFMSFFIKAAVDALRAVPALNSRMEGEELIQNHFYSIGVAVGTERGLIVPVLRDCDQKSFADIERELIGFATKAREGKVSLEDLQGGVFTVSNGGVYGSLLSTPILNPPQSGILGMHKIQERPIAVQGQVVIRPMMYLALSYDHRVIDGQEAVTALIRIKNCIENPARLLLEA
ncbi:MAG: dihydrolipoyllysine-residue succinyltransferase [Verrucomicrobia bacterium]|nr:MAG: dihydrolipoyllysine-residue succinyltransferase [Verrucomicrobiota bacterium]